MTYINIRVAVMLLLLNLMFTYTKHRIVNACVEFYTIFAYDHDTSS